MRASQKMPRLHSSWGEGCKDFACERELCVLLGHLSKVPLDEPPRPKAPWWQLNLETDHDTIQAVHVLQT